MRLEMKYLIPLAVLLIANALPSAVWSREQPPYIEKMLQGDDAIVVTGPEGKNSPVLTLGRRFGGGVVSIYYRGTEYVNNESGGKVDYGRQLQSAVQYRNANECFNPTEAGGRHDRGRPMSSSRLLSLKQPKSNVVVTQTDMAFWMAPGESKTVPGKECTALNTDVRAGYLLNRTLQVGVDGFPNVISYKTQFVAPVIEKNPRYEVLVIYTPINFSRVFRIAKDGQPEELEGKRAERGNFPYMLSTDDQLHAVVVCSANPVSDHAFYGYTKFKNTTPSRYVYYGKEEEKESMVFENYVIVGTATEVRNAARKFCFRGDQ